jgi:hypothetical protein
MKNFHRIGGTVDAQPIRDELKSQPLLWGKSPRTTFPGSPHVDVEDIGLRGPVGVEYKTLQELHEEIACEDFPAGELMVNTLKIANNLAWLLSPEEMRHLDSPLRLGRVLLVKLAPNKTVLPHPDQGPVPDFYRRFHLVVEGGDEDIFICGGEVQPMQSGDLWEIEVSEVHTVVNLMDHDRIHLIMDIER